MNIAVLGTGMVGRAHADKLASLGHDVVLGTRDAARAASDNETLGQWRAQHPDVAIDTFAKAVATADLVIVALSGRAVLPVLEGLAGALAGSVVVDITNPLDFSSGRLELFVCNTDSLGEQLQRALPEARLVKTLCTVTADIQVDPARLGQGGHDMFLAGNDPTAKAVVAQLLESYGWHHLTDLGDITAARGLEMMLPMWLQLMNALGTGLFNYRVITDTNTDTDIR